MRYYQREPQKVIVVTVAEKDIPEIQDWIRREILADPEIESVKAILFAVYQKLGEK